MKKIRKIRILDLWLEPYCSTPEVHQTSSKAGSGINILYLLTGPIRAGTRYSDPGWMQGRVGLVGQYAPFDLGDVLGVESSGCLELVADCLTVEQQPGVSTLHDDESHNLAEVHPTDHLLKPIHRAGSSTSTWDGGSGGPVLRTTAPVLASQALSLIHIWRCRRSYACRSRWSPYH